jgi:hypothetical protein
MGVASELLLLLLALLPLLVCRFGTHSEGRPCPAATPEDAPLLFSIALEEELVATVFRGVGAAEEAELDTLLLLLR